jgi:hypothetical protein
MLTDREKEFIKLSTAQVRKSSGPNTFQVTELDQFNHLDINFYQRWTEQASAWDFQWLVDMESPTINAREGVRTAIRVLNDANREHSCAIWHFKPKWYIRLLSVLFRMGPLKVVEFETLFNDDTCVVTTLAKDQGDLFHPPEIITHAVQAKSFEELYELHRLHVTEHLAEQSDRAIKPINSLEDVFSMQTLMDQQKNRHIQENHYLAMEQLPKKIQHDPDKRAAALAYAQKLNAETSPGEGSSTETDLIETTTAESESSDLTDVVEAIRQLGLSDHPIDQVEIDQHPEPAFVLGTDTNQIMQHWQAVLKAFKGHRYPVITQLLVQGDDLAEQVADQELLSRYNYEVEMEMNDDCSLTAATVQAVLAASEQVDHQQAIKKLLREQLTFDKTELEDELGYALEGLEVELGEAPDTEACRKLVRDGQIKHSGAMSGWLLNWVLKHHREAAMRFSKTDFSTDYRVTSRDKFPASTVGDMAIVLLPVKHAWQVPAVIHSEVVESIGSAAFCALARHWQDQHQAMIIGIDNCTIEWHVGKPPKNLKEALQLAILHDALAPSMLGQPGVDVWQYALSLLGRKRWCLWESPC